jgi:glycosyltransferase involved in cell wall biosynthesis
MKINIAASHRFHLLDLARELETLGHDVRFYSYVPKNRCSGFGISRKACFWMWWLIPFFILDKVFPGKRFPAILRSFLMDSYLSIFMRKADVFIALSGTYLRAFQTAKKKGFTTILERGSKHIIEQKSILDQIPNTANRVNVTRYHLKRELKGYQVVDYISVASQHVKESFIKHGIEESKIIINPYGVDFESFFPLPDVKKTYDVIMVGGWSYRKGCDILIKAINNLQLNFLHVGSLVDLGFPQQLNFTHIDSVDQKKLVNYYNQAKIFVLPSREEGLAMVQMQAVSCNLPLVCSKHSGGEDLKHIFKGTEAIFVADEISEVEITKKIREALTFYHQNSGKPFYDFKNKEKLSWKSYGERYEVLLLKNLRK